MYAIRSYYVPLDQLYRGESAAFPALLRITSYNVCYTKLLRARGVRGAVTVEPWPKRQVEAVWHFRGKSGLHGTAGGSR